MTRLRKLERKWKRMWVRIIGFFLRALEEKNFDGALNSIVILAQERLGDSILLTPLIRNLRRALPELEIHVVTVSDVYGFFKNDPNIDHVYAVKRNYPAYFKNILSKKFDLLFNTKDHPSFTFLYQTRVIRARHRVGIAHPYHKGFFNYLINVDLNRHIVEKNCLLLDHLGISYSAEDCRPYLPNSGVSAEMKDFLQKLDSQAIVGINLSAGKKPSEWSIEKWAKLLSKLSAKVLILAMPDRAQDKIRLEQSFPSVLKSPQTHSIYEAGQIIKRLQLLITPDTSLIHAASCYGTPVVGLYPKVEVGLQRFSPYGIPHRQLVSSTRKSEDVPVERVLDAAMEMLAVTERN